MHWKAWVSQNYGVNQSGQRLLYGNLSKAVEPVSDHARIESIILFSLTTNMANYDLMTGYVLSVGL
jgi:hypothetical protein